jgi:hypothetical protein
MVRSIPKYSNYENQSPYAAELKDRSTVKSCLFTSSGGKRRKCDLCQQKLVIPKDANYLMCPMCGKRTYPEKQQEQDKKILTDPNTKTTGLIVSQSRKKRRGSSLPDEQGLTDEDYQDLAALGIYPTSLKDYFV